jgi:hypothetical protein
MPTRLSATIALIEPLFAHRHKPSASCGLRMQTLAQARFFRRGINKIEAIHATYSFCAGKPME